MGGLVSQTTINNFCSSIGPVTYEGNTPSKSLLASIGSDHVPIQEVANFDSDLRIVVAPNPSNGVFNTQIWLPEHGYAKVHIIDLMGNTIESQHSTHSGYISFDIDLSKLADGIYLLEVTDHRGHRQTKRLVKTRY